MEFIAVTVRGVSTPVCVRAPTDADKAAVLARGFVKDGHGVPAHRIEGFRPAAREFGLSADLPPADDG